ncbi:hypothetical protein BC941DRAFT_178093 [Chlamydoabsidia padenii]|nr:hypothetical protein BC941DRAFT_178093 [Chlamydoabsidia padenii]
MFLQAMKSYSVATRSVHKVPAESKPLIALVGGALTLGLFVSSRKLRKDPTIRHHH